MPRTSASLIGELPLVGELPRPDLAARARADGLTFRTGPFNLRLRSDDSGVIAVLHTLYRYHRTIDPAAQVVDFTLNLQRPWSHRRWWHPQVRVRTDAQTPFEPFPLDHAFPLFEWSFNWVIAMQAHQFLMLHSAVVEKDGVAMIMPALPGSGKSTLCAALMLNGWRLISDEFGLIRPTEPELAFHPLPRPIPLKNASIEVIRRFAPRAVLGPTYPRTRKGDVAHVMATRDSQQRDREPARPGWFLFPRFQQGKALHLEPLGRGTAFLKISSNSFNYRLQGADGFRTVAKLVKRCPAYFLHYSSLEQALPRIEAMHREITLQQTAEAEPAPR